MRYMSQLTPVSAVETVLPDLCWNDIRKELAETPQTFKSETASPALWNWFMDRFLPGAAGKNRIYQC